MFEPVYALPISLLVTPFAVRVLVTDIRGPGIPNTRRFQFGIVDIWAGLPIPAALNLFFLTAGYVGNPALIPIASIVIFTPVWIHGIYLLTKAGVKKQSRRIAFLSFYLPAIYAGVFVYVTALSALVLYSLSVLMGDVVGALFFMSVFFFMWCVFFFPFYAIAHVWISSALEPDHP